MKNEAYGSVAELDIMDPRVLKDQLAFERREVEYFEDLLNGERNFPNRDYYHNPEARRRWWRRRWESIELLGLLAPDEGVVNQDALT